MATASVTTQNVADGLRALGLDRSSAVIVHSSLSSFGHVEGGAESVCRALIEMCGTVLMPAFTFDSTGVPPPPGLERPLNAATPTATWPEFDEALDRAAPYSPDLPVDSWVGRIPDTMCRQATAVRSAHPLESWVATGQHSSELVGTQPLDQPHGPIEAMEALDGSVLLLGIGHTKNTAIHLAEQRLGRSRYYRYAKAAAGVWMEIPNVGACSEGFDAIEPELADITRETMIGDCRARLVPLAAVLEAATRMILADPAALLCGRAECDRCQATLQQRLRTMQTEPPPHI